MDGIVGDFLDIEVDGGRSRGFGVGGHLEFFVGGLLELGTSRRAEDDAMAKNRRMRLRTKAEIRMILILC